MRRFRRAKARLQWLPTTAQAWNTANVGAETLLSDQQSAITVTSQNHNVSNTGNTGATSLPLTVADQQGLLFGGSAAAVLASFNAENQATQQGFGYSLRRIVGSLWVATAPSVNNQAKCPAVVAVSCGMMIRRVSPENPDTPEDDNTDTNPFAVANVSDPWIWRKVFLMSPGNAGGTVNLDATGVDEWLQFNSVFQPSNSVFTGPNATSTVDSKTRRTVKGEERLFFTFAARQVGHNPEVDDSAFEIGLGIYFDYRLLGRTFTTKGNRGNAVR